LSYRPSTHILTRSILREHAIERLLRNRLGLPQRHHGDARATRSGLLPFHPLVPLREPRSLHAVAHLLSVALSVFCWHASSHVVAIAATA